MSILDTEAITARLKNATPGPWRAEPLARSPYGTPIYGPFGSTGRADEATHIANAFKDAEFIAAAPGDIAALLAEVSQLREALEKTRTALRWALPYAEAQIGRDPTVYPAVLGGLHQARTALEGVQDD